MGISRFIRPETVTLPLSGDDTITIRKTLNNGEERGMFERARIPDSSPPRADAMKLAMAMILAYLVDWNFVGEDGTRVDIRGLSADELASVIDQLGGDTVREMQNAISAHLATETALEKKTPSGEIVS